MKNNLKILILGILMGASYLSFSQQIDGIRLNAERVKIFIKFPEWRRGGPELFAQWKNTNKILYAKEMWYYTESFYVKRNVNAEGYTLTESSIDITRFEAQRKPNEEVVVPMPGCKDALVLIPGNQLIYKPY